MIERYLVLGDVGLQYSLAQSPFTPLVLVRLPPGNGVGQRAVEYLREAESAGRQVTVVSRSGGGSRSETLAEAVPTWAGHSIRPELRALVGRLAPSAEERASLDRIAPLMVLRIHRGVESTFVEVLPTTRLRAVGAVFARSGRFDVSGHPEVESLLDAAFENAQLLRTRIICEWEGWQTFEEGVEIEAKVCLSDDVSIWGLASEIVTLIGGPEFPGFIPDVGNEMQRWEFTQETFDVLGPREDLGYIAFVTSARGTYLRHKLYTEDRRRRREVIREDVVTADTAAFLASEYPHLSVRRLPSSTRSRFDVNLESVATGHFFGIEIDEFTEHEHGQVLRQIEVEYHRSRVHDGLDHRLIDPELERLMSLIQGYLERRGVAHEAGYYSKLSFLRDCRDGRPTPGQRLAVSVP